MVNPHKWQKPYLNLNRRLKHWPSKSHNGRLHGWCVNPSGQAAAPVPGIEGGIRGRNCPDAIADGIHLRISRSG